jgi:hypothetical protein
MNSKFLVIGGAAVAAYLLWFRKPAVVKTVSNIQISPGSSGAMSVPMGLQSANPTTPGANPSQGAGAAIVVKQPAAPANQLAITKKTVNINALKPSPPILQTKVTPPTAKNAPKSSSKTTTKPGSKAMVPPASKGTPVKSLAPKATTNPAPIQKGNTSPASGAKKSAVKPPVKK